MFYRVLGSQSLGHAGGGSNHGSWSQEGYSSSSGPYRVIGTVLEALEVELRELLVVDVGVS